MNAGGRRVGIGCSIAAAVIALAGCGAGATALDAAAETCGAGNLGDNGHSLTLNMKGEETGSGDLAIDDVVCVLNELDVPDVVLDKMAATRSLDGRQSDAWGVIEASWSYHPDNGLDVILELAS